uniref:P97 cofactor p47 n=1 Tax=Heterorhabditis bacteriophora TaxID=37862 RepID=A0A1I7X9T5_HETBA
MKPLDVNILEDNQHKDVVITDNSVEMSSFVIQNVLKFRESLIRTLRDMRNDASAHDGDSGADSDGDDGQQGFFVGGSEHSGQQVLGPPSERGNRDLQSGLVDKVFEAARNHGAETISGQENNTVGKNDLHFSRGGVRLGSNLASGSAEVEHINVHNDGKKSPETHIRVMMWDNGFVIEDGPFRQFDDPANRDFIESIMQGGNRLGAVVPQVISSATIPDAVQVNSPDSANSLSRAQDEINIDSKLPVTQVQIRLPNGQRLSGKFNHIHMVSTIRNFVVTAHPEMAFSAFQLMTTFPNKVIEDESLSLNEAGLLNSVVIVKPTL